MPCAGALASPGRLLGHSDISSFTRVSASQTKAALPNRPAHSNESLDEGVIIQQTTILPASLDRETSCCPMA